MSDSNLSQELSLKDVDAIRTYRSSDTEGFFTRTQEIYLARELNKMINIPFMRERREERIFLWVVDKVSFLIKEVLPEPFKDIMNTDKDGISREEANHLENRLVTALNRAINIPFVSEKVEERIFSAIIGIVTNALDNSRKFPTS